MCKNFKAKGFFRRGTCFEINLFPWKSVAKVKNEVLSLIKSFSERNKGTYSESFPSGRHETFLVYVKNKDSICMFFLEIHREIPLWGFLFPGQMFQNVKYFFIEFKKRAKNNKNQQKINCKQFYYSHHRYFISNFARRQGLYV